MKHTLRDIDFIIEHGGDCWKHLNGKQPLNSINVFAFGLIERLYYTALGLKPLLTQMDQIPEVEFSVGIILRTAILDILIALNFHKALIGDTASTEANVEDAKQFANESLADGLRLTMKYFEKARNAGLLTDDRLKDNYSDIVNRYPLFFEAYKHDGIIPTLKFKTYHSPEKLFFNVHQQKQMKELAKFYDLYQFYSKYEHYSILYFELIRYPINQKNKYIEDVVRGMVFHLLSMMSAVSILQKEDDYYIDKLKVMSHYLSK